VLKPCAADHQLLTPLEFLALLTPHVLLRYEVTIRTYGALSTTFGKKVGWIEDPPVKEPPPPSVAQLGSPARAEAAAEVSTSLPGDPKVHTGAATAAEQAQDDEFLRKRRRNWARRTRISHRSSCCDATR
jgi:hypothetical protein